MGENKMKIYVIDNGGQWTHKEWRNLIELGIDSKIIKNTSPFEYLSKDNIDGLILSGGSPRIGLSDNLGNCREYLEKANFPILGICAGHQFMVKHFGGKVSTSKVPEFGKTELLLNGYKTPITKDIPKKSIVWESHNDEVTVVPECFDILGKSENCKVQIVKHKTKPFYGLQFHPEVEHTEYGKQIFKNFIEICMVKKYESK